MNEPSFDGLVRQLTGGLDGWAGLDDANLGRALSASQHAQSKAMRDEARLFRETFLENPSGRKVLEILLDRTLRQPMPPLGTFPNADMLSAFLLWQEAQNSFVRSIVEAIGRAGDGENGEDDDDGSNTSSTGGDAGNTRKSRKRARRRK